MLHKLTLYEDQENTLEALREGFRAGHQAQMLYAPTGAGKCLGRGTPVLLADGRVVPVENITVGDKLMGPDGGVRNVLSIATGREMLYRVTPMKGAPYVVNASHILSLKRSGRTDILTLSDGTRIDRDADIVAVNVEVFARSNKTARWCLKGWRADALEFHREPELLPFDPYWLGVWLGDGNTNLPTITKPFCEMVRWWINHAAKHGQEVTEYAYEGKCSNWAIVGEGAGRPNPFTIKLRNAGLVGNKHIPDAYKYGTQETRLKLLAGLIDSDGHLNNSNFDWISVDERMARDFAFICQSVGLNAVMKPCRKGIKSRGFMGDYYRVCVSGDTDKIPCLDKRAKPRRQIKRALVHGISVEPIGEGDYFGFAIDGDHLFLLGDFTASHNTEMAMALMVATAMKERRSAMILDRIVLCNQTSDRLHKYGIEHGVLMSGHWRYQPYQKIQVCSAQTLEKRESFPGLNLLIVDEAHAQRKETIAFIKKNPQVKAIGLSASPFTKGLAATYTNVVSATTTEDLVGKGRLCPLKVYIAKQIDMKGAKKIAGEFSQDDASDRGMKITGNVVAEWVKMTTEHFGGPRKTIVFCSNVAHGADLQAKFAEAGFNFVAISYKDSDDFKKDAIADFSRPNTSIHGLIACDILTKGFDVPDVMIGVSVRPFSKSFSSHVQQMGRVMRGCEGKEFALWLDHSGNYLRFRQKWEDLYHDGVDKLDDDSEKASKELQDKEVEAARCPKCSALWPRNSDTCAACGHTRVRLNLIEHVPGELVALAADNGKDRAMKQDWYGQLIAYGAIRGYSKGWAYANFIEKFKTKPRGLDETPRPNVSPEVARWIKSRMIAFAKSKGRR